MLDLLGRRARIVLAPVCRAEVRADARRAHRVANRRQQMDQRRGGAADLSRAAGDERRRPRRDRDTVLTDDPRLTVRLVPGPSPLRVILDSTLRVPSDARILEDDACTMVISTSRARPASRLVLRTTVSPCTPSARIPPAWTPARRCGCSVASAVRSVLVEGGARVLTSFLKARLADRLIVGIAPTILGAGTEAVGDLDIVSVASGLSITNQSVYRAGQRPAARRGSSAED